MSGRRRGPPIHPSIKDALGYDPADSDNAVYDDWKERTTRVCKPCWELKYCPYGPLVEQSPLLPPLRRDMEEQQDYYKKCLDSNTVGSVTVLTDEWRGMYEESLQDDALLLRQALSQIRAKKRWEKLGQIEDDAERNKALHGKLPPIHLYRVRYDLGLDDDLSEQDFDPETWREIVRLSEEQRQRLKEALKTGEIDDRSPLEPARRAMFQKYVDEFSAADYPEQVPPTFCEGACTIFGHICPVFFAAEAMTETEEERRIGRRHLSFATMIRIVRRDDYRCQHCLKKLQDNEVEFDHIIPISKGGSSAEHNVRLTCFECNRDKGDDYIP